jgi:sensor histidine kinase YesM
MQINKWRLFGLHYAAVLTVLFFWGFFSYYTRALIRDGEPVTWYAIKWDLFFSPWAPFPNALWPALFGTIFYLFIFQDGIQKKYMNFGIKLVSFLLFVLGANILLRACYAWLESNYTYIYYNDETWQQEQLKKGNLFKPFLPLLKWEAISFFKSFENFFTIKFSIIHLLYTAFFTLIMYVWQSRKREAELEKLQRETEIQALKAQLNPHFLFNSLNTIYSSALTEKDTSTAQLVQQLSGILRHSVEEVQQEKTDIQKELTFIEKYIALQRARLPEHPNVSIQSTLFWDQEPADIAPLLLIPLIENAFQYGVSIDEPSFVRVDLRVEDRKLHLIVENSITQHHSEKKGAGTGLKNTEKRLALLYPDRYSLHCDRQKDTFEIDLTLQL